LYGVYLRGAVQYYAVCNGRASTANDLVGPFSVSMIKNGIDDLVLTTEVEFALRSGQHSKGFDIKVEIRKGVVQLGGLIDSQTRINHAMMLAIGVKGVKTVENGMTHTTR
jgi:hyperosmotically inducible protein